MGRKDHSHESEHPQPIVLDVWGQHIELPPGTESVDVAVSAHYSIIIEITSAGILHVFLLNKGKLETFDTAVFSLVGGGCVLEKPTSKKAGNHYHAAMNGIQITKLADACASLFAEINPPRDLDREWSQELGAEMTVLSALTGGRVNTPSFSGRLPSPDSSIPPLLRHRVISSNHHVQLRFHFLQRLNADLGLAAYLFENSHRLPRIGDPARKRQDQHLTHAFLLLSDQELQRIRASKTQPDGSYPIPGLTHRGEKVHLSRVAELVG